MKKIILLFLILSFCSLTTVRAGNITIQVISPANNSLSDNTLTISATTQSVYQVASIVANVNGRIDTLNYNGTTASGNISLTGLPKGVLLQLIVTATDVFNNQQSDTVNFKYAPRPIINITEPSQSSNVYPSLLINASCNAVGKCDLKVVFYFGINSGNPYFQKDYPNGTVDTLLKAVSGSNGTATINFLATDSFGQTTSISYPLFFNNNPFLTQVDRTNDTIVDFNYSKLLTNRNKVNIVDINSNSITNVPVPSLSSSVAAAAFLTPFGAIFFDGSVTYQDWNNDSLYTFGQYFVYSPPYPGDSTTYTLHVAGNYATWEQNSNVYPEYYPDLYLRDLSTKKNYLYASYESVCEDNGVAANGHVIYNTGLNIDTHPITDGYYDVYSFTDYGVALIIMNYGNYRDTLSDVSSFFTNYPIGPEPEPGPNYQVNNKFIAYSKIGNTQLQVWLRDSSGNNSQITFFNTTSTIELLNLNGDIIFDNSGERYLARKGLQPIDLGLAAGKLYYRDSTWYVTEGTDLYKLLINAFITVNDGDWNNPSTWRDNIVPSSNADVIVENNVTVSSNETCNSLKVVSPGSVTVLTGFNLTVLH